MLPTPPLFLRMLYYFSRISSFEFFYRKFRDHPESPPIPHTLKVTWAYCLFIQVLVSFSLKSYTFARKCFIIYYFEYIYFLDKVLFHCVNPNLLFPWNKLKLYCELFVLFHFFSFWTLCKSWISLPLPFYPFI